jgi:DNA-directed RNA polymerase specialized sigma54-like protein
MEMDLDFSQDLSGQQQLRVSPRLVAASYILELSSQELQQQIANELNDNPALELVDVPTCQACGSELQGTPARIWRPACMRIRLRRLRSA